MNKGILAIPGEPRKRRCTMKNTIKGSLIILASMVIAMVIVFIHDQIINLSIWISYPLILVCLCVTLYGILKMCSEDVVQEKSE